ncbi:hypothetical protein [Sphingobacterium bovistauri]|uniref:Lipoprotein n=1 Tax=Sphingobacterium bovistauri TaxID=2781959 RepID=A0ABS7Z8R7_9SPHI|nr:hypothetical protein [Sphingobacterium bovistauri]MCA5006393.1 hypothetical protein [Sphingobacterium bovistauri]
MKYLNLILVALLLLSCDNDTYETHTKEREFTIREIKRGGKRQHRGFYVEGFESKVRYRNIRDGKLKTGDKIMLKYDSIVNKTKGTFELNLQRRYED